MRRNIEAPTVPVTIHFSPVIEQELRRILMDYRLEGKMPVETERQMQNAIRFEHQIAGETISRLLRTLQRGAPELLDGDALAAMGRLRDTAAAFGFPQKTPGGADFAQ